MLTTFEFLIGIPGLTPTVNIYPFGSDTVKYSSLSIVEQTNRKGLYIAQQDTSAISAGLYQYFIFLGSSILAVGDLFLADDGQTHRGADQSAALIVSDETGTIPQKIIIKKNTPFPNFPIFINVSKQPAVGKAGISWSEGMSLVSLDGLGFVNTINLPTEVGNGLYNLNLTAVDTNGGAVTLLFKVTGADNKILSILTQS